MKKAFYFKSTLVSFFLLLNVSNKQLNAQAIIENFEDIALLVGNGWYLQNNSTTIGSTPNWFQGTNVGGGGPFDAYNGAPNAYIAANFNNTTGTGTISNWLVSPNRTLRNGDIITFYTCKAAPDTYPDRLEVRMSTNGASTNVGTGPTAVGDFTTLLLSINPNLVVGVYPTLWSQYSVTISGLPAPTSGRLAFRYHVTNGGPSGLNSDYIGIDAFTYTPYSCPGLTISPGTLPGGVAGQAYSQTLTQTGALGAPTFNVTAGALPPSMSLSTGGALSGSPTATGTFNFTVTVNDNSGCLVSQAYSVDVQCPTGGASLSLSPSVACSNEGHITLSGGSPGGGSYSGVGVMANMFDPLAGTQVITYQVTDQYSCAQSATASITINTATTASLPALSPVCENAGTVTLSGGLPAGGSYSGTGVSGTSFDPTAGTQTITYTYVDGNNCSDSHSEVLTVNTPPAVALAASNPVCENAGNIILSGGLPAGGTYSGIGVTGGLFNPASGTQTITYTYTDGNNCTASDNEVLTVNTLPTVTLANFSPVCDNAGAVTLSGGLPAGGVYSGTGVTGGSFNPTSGTQTITYTYTDGNNCSAAATAVQPVTICTGITTLTTAYIKCFPNPVNHTLNVFISSLNEESFQVRLIDVTGKVYFTDTMLGVVNTYSKAFDVSELAAGFYLLEISSADFKRVMKVAKQ